MASLLAYRPVSVVHRLPPGSEACPLSLRHLLGARGAARGPVPFVVAPLPGIARGALLAARETCAAVGLLVPRGVDLRRWVDAVARDADEMAPGVPFAIAAEVAIRPGEARSALREAERLVEEGATHLAIHAGAGERDAALAIAALANERELGLELLLAGEEAAPLAGELRASGATVDLVGVRGARPKDHPAARAQAKALARLADACGAPLFRHGPASPELHRLLGASPVHACDDGGAALGAALRTLSPEERAALEAGGAALGADVRARMEAVAWSEAAALFEALGAAGSARGLATRLEGAR